jgi:Tol biopolymer transport system component
VIAGLAVGIVFVLLFSFLLLTTTVASQQHDRVVFSDLMNGTDDDTPQIYIVNDDGTGLTRLIEDDSLWHFEPVSSPDGSKIAYVTWNSFPNAPPDGKLVQNLYVMNTDGTNKVLLTNNNCHTGLVSRHVWAPDNAKIAFEARDDIFVVNVDGTNCVRLPNDGGEAIDLKPVWSSNSKKIMFASLLRNGTDILAASWKSTLTVLA